MRMPRSPRGRVPPLRALAEALLCALRCAVAASPFFLFQARLTRDARARRRAR